MRLIECAALGASSGMRTMAAPSQLALRRGGPLLRVLLPAAAAVEMVVDKLPGVPSRTESGGVIARTCAGAAAAGALGRLGDGSAAAGAAAGALGALGSTYISFWTRRYLTRRAGLPDLGVALCEDAVAILVARFGLRSLSSAPDPRERTTKDGEAARGRRRLQAGPAAGDDGSSGAGRLTG